jgi:aminopeptidase N
VLFLFREVALLVREGVTTTATRQNIGRIICHENMHMWFGNEVSPYSWTYTWLNEGFANFFENFATDLVSLRTLSFLRLTKLFANGTFGRKLFLSYL